MNGITNQYRKIGVDKYYEDFSFEYENPHKGNVISCLEKIYDKKWSNILDLACGDGLISKWIKFYNQDAEIIGCDKFMHDRYQKETGNFCYQHSFEDIANHKVSFDTHFDVIICSYAIDLVPSSYMAKLLWELSNISNNLLLIRPNNHLIESYEWTLSNKIKVEKSRATLYTKNNY